jgi:two-component system, cell cycle sensor histidine kinase and response regulator CckA
MPRILVVEDSPTQAQNLRIVLELEGFEVAIAPNGQAALECFEASHFDLVITDVLMPRLSGFELCQQIKNHRVKKATPVILVTELNEPMDIIQGLECGADNFITKPFSAEFLIARIHHLLEDRSSAREPKVSVAAEVSFLGRTVNVSAEKSQILDLLIASFEELVGKNRELKKSQTDLGEALTQVESYSRLMAEQARSSGDKYQRLMDQAHDAIFLLDIAGRIREVNRRAEASTGLKSADLAGKPLASVVPAFAPESGKRLFQQLVADGNLDLENVQLQRRGGGQTVVDLSASVVEVADEKVVLVIAHDVGRRNEREAVLRASEERFRQLAENIHQIFWMVDASGGQLLYVSPAYETIWGRTCQSLYDDPSSFLNDIHPKDKKRVSAAYRKNLEDGAEFEAEYRVVRDDGSIRWVWDRGFPVRDEQGAVVRHVGITEDITERKRAEQRQRVQSATTRILAEAASIEAAAPQFLQAVGEAVEWDIGELWFADAANNGLTLSFQWHSPTISINGFATASRQAVIARGVGVEGCIWADAEAVWIADLARHANFQRAAIAAQVGLHMVCGVPIRLGRSILGIIIFLNRHSRPPDEFLLGTLMTIGSQLGQFIERKRAHEALRASEERFRLFVNGVKDFALFMLDPVGNVMTWNDGAQRIKGWRGDEVLGKHFSIFFPQEDRDAGKPDMILRTATAGGQHEDEGWRVRKDGSRFLAHVVITPLYNQLGEHLGFAKVVKDETQRHQLEEQLRQAQKMEAIGQLAGGVAHDFNNILTVISGYSELALANLPPEDGSRCMIQEVAKAGARAALLTRQLLAFSRKQVLEPKVVDLNAIVGDADKMLRRLIGEDISVTTVLAPNLHLVKVDPGQIEQVIMNLVVNARDAMPRGGRLTIETGNIVLDETYAQTHLDVKAGRYVMLAVSDTGFGMNDDTKERIFEPFFTTKEPGKGTGLGMSMVYGIVKQSGGSIYVYSELDRGTSVKVYLPAVKEKLSSGKSNPNLRPAPNGTETILLVEDEPMVRAMTRIALEMYGYKVLEASHGLEAVRVCTERKTPIQLLVSDVIMPGMSGRQVVETLRPRFPAMKVLYLSGYTDDAVVRHGVLEADAAFLQKPFTPVTLANKVREVLDC